MHLRNVILFCRRWTWLLLIGFCVGILSGFIASRVVNPVYEGTAKVMVTRGQQGKAADTVFMDDIQLILTYVELPTSEAVLSAASSAINLPIKAKKVKTVQVGNSQVLEITVQNFNPENAAAMANAIVQGMIDQNKNMMAARYATTEENLQRRIEDVQTEMDQIQTQFDQYNSDRVTSQLVTVNSEIDSIQNEISLLQEEIVGLSASFNIPEKQEGQLKQYRVDQLLPLLAKYQQIKANLEVLKKPSDTSEIAADSRFLLLQSTLDQYRQIYLSLVNNLETVRLNASQYTPNVVQIETAMPPEKPIRPVLLLNTILAGLVGLILAGGGALLVDYFEDTLNYPKEILEAVDAPCIGLIPQVKESTPEMGPVVISLPGSEVAVSFQSLITNLEFVKRAKPLKSILVSAAGNGEGTTFTAVNIAAALALMGRQVVLVDANMELGIVHRFFGHAGQPGFTDLVRNLSLMAKAKFICELIPNLTIIPAGSLKEEHDVIVREKLGGLIEKIGIKIDLIIFDGPPINQVNARIIASKVDGVLLVLRAHHTRAGDLRAGLELLKLSGASIFGTVISRVSRKEKGYFI